jgi:hypothetical protein
MSDFLKTPSLTPTAFVVGEIYYLKLKGELTILTVTERTPTTLTARVHTTYSKTNQNFFVLTRTNANGERIEAVSVDGRLVWSDLPASEVFGEDWVENYKDQL